MSCANHPERERKAFCQNCGKPICVECARTIGQAVFCEPCLEVRLAAANTAATGASQPFSTGPATGSSTYQAVPGADTAYTPTGTADGIPYSARVGTPPPGSPNPGLAFLLGFVPGVGAMYNGQYAKGIVHLIVFAVLVSLSDQNGIFGLFVAAWIFYQAFEAYHTARARRDGTPLPNPFGLNDIGERLGFGRSWPHVAGYPPAAGPVAPGAYSAATAASPGATYAPPSAPPYAAADYASTPGGFASSNPFAGEPAPGWGPPPEAPYSNVGVPPLPPASRFPVGAIVLIGLGVLFLVGSTHVFFTLPGRYLLPVLLIGLGVYLFVRRMTRSGIGLADDGSAAYRLRLVRALQSSVWVVLTGVLFLLDNLNILSWGRSWPLFIIVGGVMAFVQRGASSATQQVPYTGYGTVPPPPSPVPPAPTPQAPGTSLIPRDREGS